MSRPLVPASCGFYPAHLYEGPALDRALGICGAVNAFAPESMGFDPVPAAARKLLSPLSLRDMLDALDEVERYNARPAMDGVSRSTYMVPAERLIAAVYTLLNFAPTRSDDKDDDEVPVRFTSHRWGDDYVHFLMIGQRLKSEVDREDDEDEGDDRRAA